MVALPAQQPPFQGAKDEHERDADDHQHDQGDHHVGDLKLGLGVDDDKLD